MIQRPVQVVAAAATAITTTTVTSSRKLRIRRPTPRNGYERR
jgi:hypothetical protein